MENVIEILEVACMAVVFVLALYFFINLSKESEECERLISKDISVEWLIIREEDTY